MSLQTRMLTINEMYFRQLSTINKIQSKSIVEPTNGIVHAAPVVTDLVQSNAAPDLAKPVFNSPTIWEKTMTHIGKYWIYYLLSAGVVIGIIYIHRQQKKQQEELYQ